MTLHGVIEGLRTAGSIIATASIAANFLPPASTYDDYPRFKRFYETFIVNTVAFVSGSIRAQYPSLAIPMFGLKQTTPTVTKTSEV
jgi:hypothetical protein